MQNFLLKTRFFFVGILTVLTACKTTEEHKTITIATAANMQFAMQELADTFTQKTGTSCDLVISSSGKLTAQIKEGAPYDIFVAANMKYPQEVYAAGQAKTAPKVYAYGKLVLWSLNENIRVDLETLESEAIHHIALANPKTAPYGTAAVSALTQLKIYDRIQNKLVFGESISQTNQFILSGAAELGFTAMSVVKAPSMKSRGVWISVADTLYDPIEQGVVLIEHDATTKPEAAAFYEYLFSEEAQKILQDFGYSIHE